MGSDRTKISSTIDIFISFRRLFSGFNNHGMNTHGEKTKSTFESAVSTSRVSPLVFGPPQIVSNKGQTPIINLTDNLSCDGPPGAQSPTWPPANFQCWPGTRVSAMIYVAVYLTLLILTSRKMMRCLNWNICVSPCFFGLATGLAVHFIPCIWWTCDWGYYDGEGIRGAIWFIVWAVVWVLATIKVRQYRQDQGDLS